MQILPDPAFAGATLSVRAEAEGNAGGQMTFSYQWFKNGRETGENSEALRGVRVNKGDRITVQIVPQNGTHQGAVYEAETFIANTPPRMTAIETVPSPVHSDDNLEAIGEATDVDGDLVTFDCRWMKNGEAFAEATSCSLSHEAFRRGDTLTVKITPWDGESTGVPMTSGEVIISNSPPLIVSSPSVSLSSAGDYSYQVLAEDRDRDPLIYTLISGPEGMEMDPQGRITWKINPEMKGKNFIRIGVSDGQGGECQQNYSLALPSSS